MKKLVLFGALALGMLSFTSDKVNEQIVEDGEMDCAVYAWRTATAVCSSGGGCTSDEFNHWAGLAYNICLAHQNHQQ